MTDTPNLCACGCGQPVQTAKYPSQQRRFINGHQHRGKNNGNYRGGKHKYACAVCGKSFYSWPSHSHITCGNTECYREWQRLTTSARGQNKVAINCSHCGVELRRYPSQVHTYNFCNRFCQGQHHSSLFVGPNAGNWNGGAPRYFQIQASIRDNYQCAICGFSLAYDVHHITPLSEGGSDDFSNLITLCPNHHRLAHLQIISVEHLRNLEWCPEDTVLNHSPANHSHT